MPERTDGPPGPPLARAPQPIQAVQRVGDAERDRVAGLLTEATGDGLLDLAELDERLDRVFAARTAADLALVTADFPAGWLRERDRQATSLMRSAAVRRSFTGHLRSYILVMAGLILVWLAVGATAGSWYPWPVWPALGWGVKVFAHGRAAYAPNPAWAGGRQLGSCAGRRPAAYGR